MIRRLLLRVGRVHSALLAFAGSGVVLAGLVGLLALERFSGPGRETSRPLVVYCAAGLKEPVSAVAREYQEEFGTEVQFQYGPSNTLLANLQLDDRADLYIPADDVYVRLARDKELIHETLHLCHMKPVLAVRKGNPKKIASLDDLLARELRVCHANPDTAAVGKVARDALMRAQLWERYRQRIVVSKATVNDVVNDIQVGAVDAGIVWDALVRQTPDLQTVPAPVLENAVADLSVCVTVRALQPSAALRFARYLTAPERGLKQFIANGYTPAHGDRWAETPELTVFAGAMLRPAIDETITAFEEREGAKVTRVYNGCGILVGQMKTSRSTGPDAYFACDRCFLDQVQDRFGPATTVSGNQLVILVHKGNPHKIRRLADLAKRGLRVGVGHEKQCAMGVLTQQTLREDRSLDPVMKNVKVQSPTGDLLVNQMLAGSLDAVVAYISNAAGHADRLEAIPIDIPCAFADQPFAIAKDSAYKNLAGRLLESILSRQSRERFAEYGFTWKAGAKSR
jgi:molybdenum ABC transporter molybdate-binding protein